jgi:DNA-binding transcriptional LysR family regulator
MQIKWLEDLLALAQTRNFSRAAELRHVTHPAFGRRIKALEEWAGAALLVRGKAPLVLTVAGEHLLEHARDLLQGVGQAREALQGAAGRQVNTVTLATGRTLARTLVADWLLLMQPLLERTQGQLQIRTRSLAETAEMLDRGEVDFMLTYHHALLAVKINARRYSYITMAQDQLVPVARCDASGLRRYDFAAGTPVPYLAYASSLALGRLVADHLANHPQAPLLNRVVESDSADALLEYSLQGSGVAWLPLSLVATACKAGQLVILGDARLAIGFEVRLYRPKKRLSELAEAMWTSAQAH